MKASSIYLDNKVWVCSSCSHEFDVGYSFEDEAPVMKISKLENVGNGVRWREKENKEEEREGSEWSIGVNEERR